MKTLFFLMLFVTVPIILKAANQVDFSEKNCPILGNSHSKIYHPISGQHYPSMLRKNKGADNRVCFKNDAEAQEAGYRESSR